MARRDEAAGSPILQRPLVAKPCQQACCLDEPISPSNTITCPGRLDTIKIPLRTWYGFSDSSRPIQVSTELNDFLARDWYEVGQVFCLRRRVQYPLKCTQEYVYGLTSLTPKQAGTVRLLELICEHWSIENRLHYRRDVTLAEDACQVRKGTAPHALAVLNSFVLALFDFWGVTNTKQQMRYLDAQ